MRLLPLLKPFLVAALVSTWPVARGYFGAFLGIDAAPPLPDKQGLRIATWNLRNFPRDHDRDRLTEAITDLDADVLAVQEVRDPEALQALLPDRDLLLSRTGGRNGQRLGLVIDPQRVEVIGGPIELESVALGDTLRPAVLVRLRPRSTEGSPRPTLTVIVVHLKAMPAGQGIRALQWLRLAAILETLPGPVALLGDFNLSGSPILPADQELQVLSQTLAPAALHPLLDVGECTAYWEGVRYDGWKEPSRLDAIFVRELEPLQSGLAGACARHRCRPLRSSDAHPDPDVALSDHCPMWIDVQVAPS